MAERRKWWSTAGFAVLAAVSVALLAMNFRGRTPLKSIALATAKPLISLSAAADPAAVGGEAPADPEIPLLRAKNARLSHEVTRLREMLESVSGSKFDGKRYAFKGIPARVISGMGEDTSRRMILVDRGADDGVLPGMGVVMGDMAVGRVFRTGDELSLVLLLTDPGCRLRCTVLPLEGTDGATAASSEIEGLCEGIFENEEELAMRHVSCHAEVSPGMDVVTNGRGGAFPAGISVGTVTKAADGYELFLEVRVKPSAAGGRISSVMILVPSFPREKEGIARVEPVVGKGR